MIRWHSQGPALFQPLTCHGDCHASLIVIHVRGPWMESMYRFKMQQIRERSCSFKWQYVGSLCSILGFIFLSSFACGRGHDYFGMDKKLMCKINMNFFCTAVWLCISVEKGLWVDLLRHHCSVTWEHSQSRMESLSVFFVIAIANGLQQAKQRRSRHRQ